MHMAEDVSPAIAARARAVTAAHPLGVQALAHIHCESDVFRTDKQFVQRGNISDAERASTQLALADEDSVLVVIYQCAERPPLPMAGRGPAYVFLLHPHSLALLSASVSTWMS